MSAEQIPMTPEGQLRLSKELEVLKHDERPKVIQDISEARAHGDLKENAEYHAAKEKQSLIEGRIAELEDKLSRAEIINPQNGDPDLVRFGAHVTVADEETGEEKSYQIVGDIEADITPGRLSLSSPIAKALLGKRVSDVVQIAAPKGKREISIIEVHYV
jgi:transcription elongation factor GreA